MGVHKAGLVSGVVGGLMGSAVAFSAINYLCTVADRPGLSDAFAIANTYIVFTTVIFVAITLFLTVAGLWFTQQFSTSKELQIKHLIGEIETMLADNENQISIKLIDKAFSNPDVSRHVQEILEQKIAQLLKSVTDDAKNSQVAADELAKKLDPGGRK